MAVRSDDLPTNPSARLLSRRAWLQTSVMLAGGAAVAGQSISGQQPAPASRQFDIKTYGAAGVRTESATAACQAAIDACTAAGGGIVIVPPREYSVGMLQLKDNVGAME